MAFTLALNNSEIAPAEADDVLKAWVLYENAAIGNRALMLLHRVAGGIEGTGRMLCALLRLDCLADGKLSKALAQEAQAADIIVVATHDGRELPHAFKDWISLWISAKAGRPAALAVVLDVNENQRGGRRGVAFQLAEVARLGGLDFFATGGGRPAAAIAGELTHALARRNGPARATLS